MITTNRTTAANSFRTMSRARRSTKSRLTFLMLVWTLASIFQEQTVQKQQDSHSNNIHIHNASPIKILLVEAVWYSEICHAGPRYKVRIDPISGNVVPVYPEGYVPIRASTSFGSNNNNNNNYYFNSNKDAIATNENDETISTAAADDDGDDPIEDLLLGSSDLQKSNETNSDHKINQDNNNNYANNITFGGDSRLLRSKRMWRNFDEDSETDAIVVRTKTSITSSTTSEQEQEMRALFLGDQIEDDLEPGEFYVKPCICQDSRWTFERDAGFEQMTMPPSSSLNDTIDNGWTPNDTFTIFPPTPENSPNNFGLLPNNQLTYVQDGAPHGDLYLCRAQAMYCGVLMGMDSNMAPMVKCYDQNMRHIIARNAWPLILLWYFGLAIICCCTVHGRTAGDYVQDRLTHFFKKFVCCCWDLEYDFNDRMLNRMIRDDERERRRRRGYSQNGEMNDDDESIHPWYFSNQRLQFERSLMAQVQWIWRHQEYMREINLREQGLPPPQLKLKVKRFRMETSTSNSREGGFSSTASPPPSVTTTTTTTTTTTSKEDSLKQQKGSVFGSIGRKLSSDNGNSCGEGNGNGASTTTTVENESTCSYSSAENILASKENVRCRVCIDGNKEDSDEKSHGQGGDDESEFVTLDLGPEEQYENNEDNQNIDAESAVEHDCNDLDSLDAPTCAICFCAFEEGDRIGNLTCKHEFHIDCLKGWVQRKNACPLCNVRLGKPERPLPPPQDENNNNNNNGNENSIDGSRHSLSSMMHWLRNGSNNNSNAGGAGEIQIGSRMGMIGAVSAAADINAARERVARRGGGIR